MTSTTIEEKTVEQLDQEITEYNYKAIIRFFHGVREAYPEMNRSEVGLVTHCLLDMYRNIDSFIECYGESNGEVHPLDNALSDMKKMGYEEFLKEFGDNCKLPVKDYTFKEWSDDQVAEWLADELADQYLT